MANSMLGLNILHRLSFQEERRGSLSCDEQHDQWKLWHFCAKLRNVTSRNIVYLNQTIRCMWILSDITMY